MHQLIEACIVEFVEKQLEIKNQHAIVFHHINNHTYSLLRNYGTA